MNRYTESEATIYLSHKSFADTNLQMDRFSSGANRCAQAGLVQLLHTVLSWQIIEYMRFCTQFKGEDRKPDCFDCLHAVLNWQFD